MIYPKPKWVGDRELEIKAGNLILEYYPKLQNFVPVHRNHTPNRWTHDHAMIPHINDCLMIFRKGFVFNVAAWDYFMKNDKPWGDDDGVFFPIRYDGQIKLWNQNKKRGENNQYYSFKSVADRYLMSNREMLSQTASRFFNL